MFSTILVASDGSPLSAKAADAAIASARESGAELIALSVAVPYPLLGSETRRVPARTTIPVMVYR